MDAFLYVCLSGPMQTVHTGPTPGYQLKLLNSLMSSSGLIWPSVAKTFGKCFWDGRKLLPPQPAPSFLPEDTLCHSRLEIRRFPSKTVKHLVGFRAVFPCFLSAVLRPLFCIRPHVFELDPWKRTVDACQSPL